MEAMWVALLYGFKGSIMVVSFCFCIDNIEDAVDSPSPPWTTIPPDLIQRHEVFMLRPGFRAVNVIVTVCSAISVVATVSRQMVPSARNRVFPIA